MNSTLTELTFGGQTVTVAAIVPSGSEYTSAADRVRDSAVDALERAGAVIESVAKSTVDTARRLQQAATSPSSVEVELGIAFTAQGHVIVAGAGVQASIVVHLTYDLSKAQG